MIGRLKTVATLNWNLDLRYMMTLASTCQERAVGGARLGTASAVEI